MSHARARRGELEGGGEEMGAGMMQCLATGVARARAGDYEGGGRCGGREGVRREGGAPVPLTQRPQRLSTVAVPRLPSETSL